MGAIPTNPPVVRSAMGAAGETDRILDEVEEKLETWHPRRLQREPLPSELERLAGMGLKPHLET